MVAGHSGGHGRGVTYLVVVDSRAERAAVHFRPQGGAEVSAMETVA